MTVSHAWIGPAGMGKVENFGVFQTEVFHHSSSMEQGTSGLGHLDRTAAGKAPIPGDLLVRQFPAAA